MARRYQSGPVPTLEGLQREAPWFWVYCNRLGCNHSAPMAVAPLVIRWGPDASSNNLRQSARCTRCGRKGATLRHPSFINLEVGIALFPIDQMGSDRP